MKQYIFEIQRAKDASFEHLGFLALVFNLVDQASEFFHKRNADINICYPTQAQTIAIEKEDGARNSSTNFSDPLSQLSNLGRGANNTASIRSKEQISQEYNPFTLPVLLSATSLKTKIRWILRVYNGQRANLEIEINEEIQSILLNSDPLSKEVIHDNTSGDLVSLGLHSRLKAVKTATAKSSCAERNNLSSNSSVGCFVSEHSETNRVLFKNALTQQPNRFNLNNLVTKDEEVNSKSSLLYSDLRQDEENDQKEKLSEMEISYSKLVPEGEEEQRNGAKSLHSEKGIAELSGGQDLFSRNRRGNKLSVKINPVTKEWSFIYTDHNHQ